MKHILSNTLSKIHILVLGSFPENDHHMSWFAAYINVSILSNHLALIANIILATLPMKKKEISVISFPAAPFFFLSFSSILVDILTTDILNDEIRNTNYHGAFIILVYINCANKDIFYLELLHDIRNMNFCS